MKHLILTFISVLFLTSCGKLPPSMSFDDEQTNEQFHPNARNFTTSGLRWARTKLITISFMPEKTLIGTQPNNLPSTCNAKYPTTTWQGVFLDAANKWAAALSPGAVTFVVVPDNGQPQGSPAPINTESTAVPFGDIRIGGYNSPGFFLASTYGPYMTTTRGGDISMNTAYGCNINSLGGSGYDLFSIALHELGHAMGLAHSSVVPSVMAPTISRPLTSLEPDDIAGIRSIYP